MSYTVKINNHEIPSEDILQYPARSSKLSYDNSLMAESIELEIDNTFDKYSDSVDDGFFFGFDWYNKPLTIFDDDLNVYIWNGRIKGLAIHDSKKTVTVKTSNYIRDMVDINCVLTDSGVTPAEAILNILTDVIEIPNEFINVNSFNRVIAVQSAAGATVTLNLTAQSNKKCSDVIQELRRLSNIEVYTVDHIIHCWQWQEWDGMPGLIIDDSMFTPGTIDSEYNTDAIYNAYSIAYKSGTAVAFATGTTAGTAGDKQIAVPDKDNGTTLADFPIIFETHQAATWAGELYLSRFANPIKVINFEVGSEGSELEVNNQVDLTYDNYIREPVRIIEYKYDTDKLKCTIKGEFLNLPKKKMTGI